MSQVITKRSRISRRRLLRGITLSGGAWVGLPPLVAMFQFGHVGYYVKLVPESVRVAVESLDHLLKSSPGADQVGETN